MPSPHEILAGCHQSTTTNLAAGTIPSPTSAHASSVCGPTVDLSASSAGQAADESVC